MRYIPHLAASNGIGMRGVHEFWRKIQCYWAVNLMHERLVLVLPATFNPWVSVVEHLTRKTSAITTAELLWHTFGRSLLKW
jgi:2-keto-3-deoxy-galactonokinase